MNIFILKLDLHLYEIMNIFIIYYGKKTRSPKIGTISTIQKISKKIKRNWNTMKNYLQKWTNTNILRGIKDQAVIQNSPKEIRI